MHFFHGIVKIFSFLLNGIYSLNCFKTLRSGGSMLWASSLNSSSCTSVHLYSLKSWERRSATSWVVITCSVIIIVGFDLKKDEKVSTISRDLELKNYEAGKLWDERRKLLAFSC